jgi:hypothetical protein
VALACALLAAGAFDSLPFEVINQAAPAVLAVRVDPCRWRRASRISKKRRAFKPAGRYGDQRPALFQIAFGFGTQITCAIDIFTSPIANRRACTRTGPSADSRSSD